MIPIPTGRLVIVAAVASVAIVVLPGSPPLGLLLVNAVLLLLAAVDAMLAVDPGAISIERTLPSALSLGGTGGTVRWSVTNLSSRPVHIRASDELAPSLRPGSRRLTLAIPRRGKRVAETRITPSRRGRFTVSEMVVRVDGPLGLASRQRSRHLPAVLRVLPAFPSRRDAELRIQRALSIGIRSTRGRGAGSEFDSLREYGVDDEFRRIDWAATARADKPIVRTYRPERNQQVVVLLDTGRGMAGRIAGVPRLEHGIDAALALTSIAARLGDRCGLVAFDRDVRAVAVGGAGPGQLARLVESVYDLGPRLEESDYHGAFVAALSRFPRRSLLVLITELTEEAMGETLLPALPLLLSRHLVIVASVADPTVAEWASAEPDDAGEAFRTAAAVRARARRSASAATLRAMGAVVCDAGPGVLAGALADAYLEIKGDARL